MMFLDCPAYLDDDGTRRCGLPAEVRCRFTLRSSDGPLEAATIRCPAGHWFNGTIESLTWDGKNNHNPGTTEAGSRTGRDSLQHGHNARHGDGGSAQRDSPAEPKRKVRRPNGAPAYYQGRPAALWITAMSPRCRNKPVADAQHPAGEGQPPNSAHEPSQALAIGARERGAAPAVTPGEAVRTAQVAVVRNRSSWTNVPDRSRLDRIARR